MSKGLCVLGDSMAVFDTRSNRHVDGNGGFFPV